MNKKVTFSKNPDNNLIKAYFQCSVALALARKGGAFGKDEVPLQSMMVNCYDEFVEGFATKFDYAAINEDGEVIWPSNNKRGLVGPSYEYWERAVQLAIELDSEDVQKEFGRATTIVISEQDDDMPHFFPDTFDYEDNQIELLGTFAADRVDWWLRKAYQVMVGVDRVHWKPVHQCERPADILGAMEATVICKDSDTDVNDAVDIDHHDTYDVGTMSRSEMRARFGNKTTMELVEYNKWEPLMNGAKAWYRVVLAANAEELLKERLMQSITSSKEYVDGLKKNDAVIPARKRRKAVVASKPAA